MKCTYYLLTVSFLLFYLTAFTQTGKPYAKAIKKHRKQYKKDFLEGERSPLEKKHLKYLRFFDANPNYKVEAKFTRTEGEKPIILNTSNGKEKKYIKYGELTFDIDGQPQKLAVYQILKLMTIPMYKDYLFLPFKDLTNGHETYGGGRYIDFKMGAIKSNLVTLDFNKAYNPLCSFGTKDGYSCPIPPQENHLAIPIKAGEKQFALNKDH